MTHLRADLYHMLAEALAEPPEWLAGPGYEWPLFETATVLARFSEAARRAVKTLAAVGAEPLAGRKARYTALFVGPGRPRLWLYESAYLNGRLLGPETFAVEKLYQAAGLETVSAELPDHASLELAFLSYLVEQSADSLAHSFIEKHAGRWLIDLGRALAQSSDEVYAPIGQLLTDWLEEADRECTAPHGRKDGACVVRHSSSRIRKLPVIPHAGTCTLCSFCVQACPTRALVVRENAHETMLMLSATACIGCGKCERICEAHALKMDASGPVHYGVKEASPGWSVLRQSPRVTCQACGTPIVSRAELDFVAAQIGYPAWLDYCPECRLRLLEERL